MTLWTALRSPAVQTVTAKRLLKNASKKIGTNISIGRIRYGFNRNLVIRDLYIEDEQKDTLLYIARFETLINDLDLNNKTILFDDINIRNLYTSIYQFNDSVFNFSFILDNLKKDKSKPFLWFIECTDFTLRSSKVHYNSFKGVNYRFDDINIEASEIVADSAKQNFILTKFNNKLNHKEFVNNFKANAEIKKNLIKLEDLNFSFKNSNTKLAYAYIKPPKKKNKQALEFNANLTDAKIILADLSNWIPALKNERKQVSIKGFFSSDGTNLNSDNFDIDFGNESNVAGRFLISDFKDFKKSTFDVDIEKFYTTITDIDYLKSYFNADSLQLPSILDSIQDVSYQGILTGNYYNVYTKGEILSQLGHITTDLSLSSDTLNHRYFIDGNLKAKPMYPGSLLNNNQISEVSFDLNTSGYLSKQTGPDLKISGYLKQIHLSNYTIDSISISGSLVNKKYQGNIASFDPNLRFDFNGNISFDTIPTYDFDMILYSANLNKLNVIENDSTTNLSFVVDADFKGSTFNNATGEIDISEIFYFSDTSFFATDSVLINIHPSENGKRMYIYSEYAEANIEGNFNSLSLYRTIKTLTNHYLPSLGFTPSKEETQNKINFDILINYPHPVAKLINPKLKISPGTYIYGELNAENFYFNVTLESDQISFKEKSINNLRLNSFSKNNKANLLFSSSAFNYTKNNSLKNFNISSIIFNDSIETNLNWNNWLDKTYSGNINTLIAFNKVKNRKKPDIKLDINPSNINVLDTIWYLSKGFIFKDSVGIQFHNIKLDNGSSKWELQGKYTDNPNDSIFLNVEKVNVNMLNILLKNNKLNFGGNMTGKTLIKDLSGDWRINSELSVQHFTLNDEIIGNTQLNINYIKGNNSLIVSGKAENSQVNTFGFDGYISLQNKEINIDTYFKDNSLDVLRPFLAPTLDHVDGIINGNVKLYGSLKNPSWKGGVFVHNTELRVAPTNVLYYFDDSIHFNQHQIIFKNLKAYDRDRNILNLNGTISHNRLIDFQYDINITSKQILAIDLKQSDSPYYNGRIYGSGDVKISGYNNQVNIDIAAQTKGNSFIQIPLEGKGDIKENDFIQFINPTSFGKKANKKTEEIAIKPKALTNIKIDLDVTPDIEVQIIFDPRVGDMLRANGVAHLNIESLGPNFNMYGDYTINKGDFLFTLQNVINKRLDIQQGSTVSWTGHPLDAVIDMDAIYKIRKASVYELTLDEADKEKRVEVNTHLLMTGKLINPNIKFSVNVPTATNDDDIDQLNSLPEEELNKQVLSLLLVNRFTALSTYQSVSTENTGTQLTSTTASELLSNQLSNWMSQISNDVDLGFVYRPGDQNTEQEVEFALSTNLFNDRIIFNGNVGYSKNQENIANNPYTTGFQVEYKLTQKGNLRLRAFQKPNNEITYTQALYTQGVGIFYTDEFDTFGELMQKMFRKETAKKPDDIKLEDDNDHTE